MEKRYLSALEERVYIKCDKLVIIIMVVMDLQMVNSTNWWCSLYSCLISPLTIEMQG